MSAPSQTASVKPSQSRRVTAVLGPTNTGKTHLAIERMLGHESGLIGLPLRLLAREVYDKIVARIGPRDVALITGEEKIKPERPKYYVCTVEAMPRDVEVDFLAVDEIQLAADPDRGHVFTDRLFHSRGMSETLLLGAQTMADPIRELIPGANFISRPRLSKLTYAGQKKITRLQSRSAIIAFSASDVYAIAELIRRQRGGAAVILGALSPRTRNAQVALYQSGQVDFLVATDAVGMGLNLDVDHVAFAGVRKFDGRNHRSLTTSELGQIAGRAGRHLNDGTFGVTADVEPFNQELINKLENHDFEPVKLLQWRNTKLDFDSIEALKNSLRVLPDHQRLTRARAADDLEALELAANDSRVAEIAKAPAAVKQLWEVCQVPDYRKVAPASHAELITTLYKSIMSDEGVIPEDWFATQVEQADKIEGDIDTLSNRIAHIRTWTFVSNRREWLKDPDGWQAKTREIEDRLSDALHEQLTQRFVDKRTSILMKSMRDKENLFAEIEKDGRVVVEKHFLGKLEGFRFTPDAAAAGVHGKAARNAAAKVLVHELAARSDRLNAAADTAFSLTRDGQITWENQEIGRITASDDTLRPTITIYSDEHLAAGDKNNITKRIETWLTHYIEIRLKPLMEIDRAEDISGLAKGIAFQLKESFGILRRDKVAEDVKSLDQEGRAQLRKYGVRFGAHNIYFPLLLKPASSDLSLLLWLLKHGEENKLTAASIADAPRQGLTSVQVNPALPEAFYKAAGYNVCGPRAVRVDMLERLADLIRPLTAWKPTDANTEPPPGAAGGGAFKIRPEMMSIMGCSTEELSLILESLGFKRERRPIKKTTAIEAAAVKNQDDQAIVVDMADATDAVLIPEPIENDTVETASEEMDNPAVSIDAVAETAFVSSGIRSNENASAELEAATAVGHTTPETANVVKVVAPDTTIAPAAEADNVATAGAEPEFEDVWRFRRPRPKNERSDTQAQNRPRRHHHDRDRPSQAQPTNQAAAGTSAFNQNGQNTHQNRRHDAVDKSTSTDRPHDRQRFNRRDDNSDRQKHGSQSRDQKGVTANGDRSAQPQAASDRRNNDKKFGGGQQDHRNRNNRRDNNRPHHSSGKKPFAATAAPKKSQTPIDPDSPFAALSRLKEQLEKQVQP